MSVGQTTKADGSAAAAVHVQAMLLPLTTDVGQFTNCGGSVGCAANEDKEEACCCFNSLMSFLF